MKSLSDNQKIAYTAVLSALGFIINMIHIPWPLVPYLQIEASEIVVLLGLLISLPIAITIAIVKALLMTLFGGYNLITSASMLIGSFTLLFSYYLFINKLKLNKYLSYFLIVIIFTIIMPLCNFLFVDPFFYKTTIQGLIQKYTLIGYVRYIAITYIPFNIFKASITLFLLEIVKSLLFNKQNKEEISL